MNGSNWSAWSSSSKFDPSSFTSSGRESLHGVTEYMKSAAESVFPGMSAGETNTTASSA